MGIHRKLKREDELDFFEQYEGVVFGVMKRLTIHPNQPNYDDYTQIGRLKLVHAYETFPKDPRLEENRRPFVSFAFTKIRWAIIDEIRKQCLKQEREQVWDESFDHTLTDTSVDMYLAIHEKEWLERIFSVLKEDEKRLVVDLCLHQMTMTAIAKKESVSRKTLYQRRNRIKEKLLKNLYPEKGK